MASICDFLKDILPTDAAKVQAWAAVMTLFAAFRALYIWKDQKKQDIVVEGKSNIFISLDIFEKLTDISNIIYRHLNVEEKGNYQGVYKMFLATDLKTDLNEKSIIMIIEAYEKFKEETIDDNKKLFYEASKIITYKNSSRHLKKDLKELQVFYNSLISQLRGFDVSMNSLEVTLIGTSLHGDHANDSIQFAQKILTDLILYKTTISIELKQRGFKIIELD